MFQVSIKKSRPARVNIIFRENSLFQKSCKENGRKRRTEETAD